MTIDYLKNNPVLEALLADLSCAEWQHLYDDWNREAANASARNEARRLRRAQLLL